MSHDQKRALYSLCELLLTIAASACMQQLVADSAVLGACMHGAQRGRLAPQSEKNTGIVQQSHGHGSLN
jgi:hypothetical protein